MGSGACAFGSANWRRGFEEIYLSPKLEVIAEIPAEGSEELSDDGLLEGADSPEEALGNSEDSKLRLNDSSSVTSVP